MVNCSGCEISDHYDYFILRYSQNPNCANCQVAHGRDTMPLHEYLLKMTKNHNVSKFIYIASYRISKNKRRVYKNGICMIKVIPIN